MRKLSQVFLIAAIFSLFLGCGETQVNWGNYSPEVKQRIDKLMATKNCQELQKEFNTAASNSDAQRRRTGEGNSSLMSYIDENMRTIGCYA